MNQAWRTWYGLLMKRYSPSLLQRILKTIACMSSRYEKEKRRSSSVIEDSSYLQQIAYGICRRVCLWSNICTLCGAVGQGQWRILRDVLLEQRLLAEIGEFSDYYVFQQDGAPANCARDTVRFLERLTPYFIPPTLRPPNSPDLKPVDYKIWGLFQERIYKTKVRDVEDLSERILKAWDELELSIMDTSVNQWRERHSACVAAQGGHIEQLL